MKTWKAIDSLRVVREFRDEPLPDEHIDRIVDAGRRTGSSKNLQRWAFVVVRERDALQRLSEAGQWTGHIAGAAAAIALVSPDPQGADRPLSIMWDLGRAAQNMILAAWELGIGSCPGTVYEHEVVAEQLGLPEDQHCEYILSFGYPLDPTALTAPKRTGGRVSRAEVRHDETW